MRQEATVIVNKGNEVIVGCDKSACSGCHGSFFCKSKDTSFTALNPENIQAGKGAKVEIDMPSGKTVKSILISLALPLILFLPGYFIATLFTDNEFVMLLFGVLFMALGFLFSFAYFKKRRNIYMPTIIREKREDIN